MTMRGGLWCYGGSANLVVEAVRLFRRLGHSDGVHQFVWQILDPERLAVAAMKTLVLLDREHHHARATVAGDGDEAGEHLILPVGEVPSHLAGWDAGAVSLDV